MSTNNILSPASGEPIIVPSQDVVLGLYYMTRDRVNAKGEGMTFADAAEVLRAYRTGTASLHARVKVRIVEHVADDEGNVARRAFARRNDGWPRVAVRDRAEAVAVRPDQPADGQEVDLGPINACYRNVGLKETVIFADQLMYTGFAQSTASGASIGVEDFVIPQAKAKIIGDAEAEVKEIESQYASGLVTQGEKYNKVVDIWSRANDLVARSMMDGISKEKVVNRDGKDEDQASFNSVYIYSDSGARGSPAQIDSWPVCVA